MNRYWELILILSKILSGFTGVILISSIILGYFLYDRLDKPNGIKHMRLLCHVIRISTFLYIILKMLQFSGLLIETKYYTRPSGFSIVMNVITAFIGIYTYFRYCLYYLKHRDNNEIVSGWHIRKYFATCKNKKDIEQAYSHLQKASELKADSIFAWSMMAFLNERCFDKSDLADEYIEKAQKIVNTSNNPSNYDKAVFEAAMGEILLCRNSIDEGLLHLKNACDLNPSSFKEKYEKALKWASEEEKSKTS